MSDDSMRAVDRRARALLGPGARPMPFVGDETTEAIDLVAAYMELAAVSKARARFLGELLAEQYALAQEHPEPVPDPSPWGDPAPEAPGGGLSGPDAAAGLVGHVYAAATLGHGDTATMGRIATHEEVRALVRLEGEERDRAARLVHNALKLGVQLQQLEVMRTYAATTSAALRSFVAELGLSLDDEPVLRAAQRAGLAARRVLGHDDGSPDEHIGPAMSPAERVRVLRPVLMRAESVREDVE